MTNTEFVKVFLWMENNCVSPFEGKAVTKERRDDRMSAFWAAFQHYSEADFRLGVQHFLNTTVDTFFPRPAHILQALRDAQPTHRTLEIPEEQTPEQRERQERLIADIDEWISRGCCKMDEDIVDGGVLGGSRS